MTTPVCYKLSMKVKYILVWNVTILKRRMDAWVTEFMESSCNWVWIICNGGFHSYSVVTPGSAITVLGN
jgi:hypothetical protein